MRVLGFTLFLASMFFLALPPLSASSPLSDAKIIDGWFTANENMEPYGRDSCTAKKTFQDGTKFSLNMFITRDVGNAEISFDNDDWTSLESMEWVGSTQPTLPLTLTFSDSENSTFSAAFLVGGLASLRTEIEHGNFKQLLVQLAAASDFDVTTGQKSIGRWSLAGSKSAVLTLLDCVRSDLIAKNERLKNDPFRQ